MGQMTSDQIREQVSEAYAKALAQAEAANKEDRCCAPACCEPPAGVAAKLAGYEEELEQHAAAGKSSFGCGNPLAFAGVKPGETVLDLGSGAGFDLMIAAEKVGPEGKVIGVDMTDEMLEAARNNAAKAGYAQIELRKGVIEKLPVEDGSVDWVISNCVVNLSPEKDKVFAEISRVLRPGGRFSISDIVVETLPQSVRDFAAAYHACIAGAISEQEYLAGLRAAGLEDTQATERFVYELEHLRGLVGTDLELQDAEPAALDQIMAELEKLPGSVASVRISGRKPQ